VNVFDLSKRFQFFAEKKDGKRDTQEFKEVERSIREE